jgi:hypothetical protein
MESPLGAGFAGGDYECRSIIDRREGLKPRN